MNVYETIFILLIASVGNIHSKESVREKRSETQDNPKILTQDGHLVFQSGTNHNISFISSEGGYINLGGVSAEYIFEKIDQHETNLVALQGLIQRITSLESQLANVVDDLRLADRNECGTQPCLNGGTCVDTHAGYTCICTNNWQGQSCETDVNECLTQPCQNGGSCMNLDGTFRCDCTADWEGNLCSIRYDPCLSASSDVLCGHGVCMNVHRTNRNERGYTCLCDSGWKTSDISTDPICDVDVNECEASNPPCSFDPEVQCTNLDGEFSCGSCPPGYMGNGFTCSDVDECSINNGGCSLVPHVECLNTRGSRVCAQCPTGYEGDGRVCSWIGFCRNNNGGCHPLATCTESQGNSQRSCVCPSGYVGNGVGDLGCIPIPICDTNPCQNGGSCMHIESQVYSCICVPGFSGIDCETRVYFCDSQPCHNGGTCVEQAAGFTCQCSNVYTGDSCETEMESCGGDFTGESGTIMYPSHDRGLLYPHGIDCVWTITTSANKLLLVTVPSFHLGNFSCNDFLQLNDGPSVSAQLLVKLCPAVPPSSAISSQQNQMSLWFHSDESVADQGFELHWISLSTACGGDLNTDHGTISSPGYPIAYPNNRDCVWRVTVSSGKHIMFTFAALDLEQHDNCSFDYLMIRDGSSPTSTPYQSYCSSIIPAPFTTSGPNAYILFHSDEYDNAHGFHVTYSAVTGGSVCGGNQTANSGVIMSPNYPQSYRNNEQCVWTIRAQEHEYISLTFTNINIESQPSCDADYVQIKDGLDKNSPLLGQFCGSALPDPITSTSNSVKITFHSDDSVTAAGFRITWTFNCGGFYDDLSGMIQSPNFPGSFQADEDCVFIITQTLDYSIILEFISFAVGSQASNIVCLNDYIEVRDGSSSSSPLIGQYCGTTLRSIASTENYMWVKLHSSTVSSHFQARYRAVLRGCGGSLEAGGSFSYPIHSGVYTNNLNCTWELSVSQGSLIGLTFNTLDMEGQEPCRQDYVEVFDSSAASLGRFCGFHSLPISLTSSDSTLTVQLITDSENGMEGFSATYMPLEMSECGGDLYYHTGSLVSPNYPEDYYPGRVCIWRIIVPSAERIQLNIVNFDLEDSATCFKDYLEIRSGFDSDAYLNGKYCGTNITNNIVSNANGFYIKFRSDATVNSRGFQIFYNIWSDGCNEMMRSDSGALVSPNYPLFGRVECGMEIEVTSGHRIMIEFKDFSFGEQIQQVDCSREVFNIMDQNRWLAKYCGGLQVAQPVLSFTNHVYLNYFTDHGKFHLDYEAVCGMFYFDKNGVIESPNFPEVYPSNSSCDYYIETSMGDTITVTFSEFDLGDQFSCSDDFVEIRDGNSSDSALISRLCGTSILQPITSTGSSLMIRFVSGSETAGTGFRLRYVINVCGANLFRDSGTITSPGYPHPQPQSSSRECDWLISVNPAKSIELNITDFDVESRTVCSGNVLQIYAGSDTQAVKLTELCHKQFSPMIVTSGSNYMFLKYISDGTVTGRGFTASYRTITGGCGGTMTTDSGIVMSKNYPKFYPHNADCHYLITVAEGSTVVLTFLDFRTEVSTPCEYDYVQVLDGGHVRSPQLMKACGTVMPNPRVYQSTSNVMLIRMVTDFGTADRGFKAKYETGCGGVIRVGDDGSISSPNHPGNYGSNVNCTWQLQALGSSAEHIKLTFTHLDVISDEACDTDYISVLDGSRDSSTAVGTYCGSSIPQPIVSLSSALTVHFVSDASSQGSGFRATYSRLSTACGGKFFSRSGTLSIGDPTSINYPDNIECVWLIPVSPGSRVQLSFSMFDVEPDLTCNKDYVEIKDGGDNGSYLGRFCGAEIPHDITAEDDVWMKFRSDSSNGARGFITNYMIVPGGTYIGSSGQLASPRHPFFYPHNSDITWQIEVPGNELIRIEFLEFDIEGTSDCRYDYIRLRDGTNSQWLPPLCGSIIPDAYYSTTPTVYVHFQSDAISTGRGFLLNWTAVQEAPANSNSTVCGGVIYASESTQVFAYPESEPAYLNNLDCIWRIISDMGTRIKLTTNYIDIEGPSCLFDQLIVYPYNSIHDNPEYTLCGQFIMPTPMVSLTNQFTLHFITDSAGAGMGFSLNVTTICGGDVIATSGHISSPNFTEHNFQDKHCTWIVRVPEGRTIHVVFRDRFDIPQSENCQDNYVMLRNGGSSLSPPLGNGTDGRYCGTSHPPTMYTASHQMYVEFSSSNQALAPSFFWLRFHHVEVTCGSTFSITTDAADFIQSPDYPLHYRHNLECVWHVSAPFRERVQINFHHFDIQLSEECAADFIELRDGSTENSPLIAVYCGDSNPGSVSSTGRNMFIRFKSGSEGTPGTGFSARLKTAECGGTISADSGVITSPYFPQRYPTNMTCEWFFNGPRGHYLKFTFTEFRLESTDSCSTDFLEIRDRDSTGALLLHICGERTPWPVNTSDSFGYIKFVSDTNVTNYGFSVTVTSSIEECGGTLLLPSGVISSPNYPGLYPHARVCDWRITVEPDRRVTLTFDDFDIESTDCAGDHVIVYDGILDNSPPIDEFCGTNVPTVVESSGSRMRIVFQTDSDDDTNHGFHAQYTSNNEAVCGGDFSTDSGNIISPDYGTGFYPVRKECIWTLHGRNLPSSPSSVVFYFDDFQLEDDAACIYDLLEIREGNDENGDIVGVYCGNLTSTVPVLSLGPNLWIRFRSDEGEVGRGFMLRYNYTGCGGRITDETGVITSPNYPEDYSDNTFCMWHIQAPDGSQISVQLIEFSVQNNTDCDYNYLEVLNGGYIDSPSIGKFCGRMQPPSFVSGDTAVRIALYASNASAISFRLTYSFQTAGCGGLHHAKSGRLSSPNYPHSYLDNTECIWDIVVPESFHALLTFNPVFDLEINPTCAADYIELTEVIGSEQRMMGLWCANHAPAPQSSLGSHVKLKFYSDGYITGNGFSMDWNSVCGSTYVADSGVIVTPNYPNAYDINLDCYYTIIAQTQTVVTLRFSRRQFEIEGIYEDCRFDYVQIYHGNDTTGELVGKFCGTNPPFEPIRFQTALYLHFHSDEDDTYRGFRATFSSECGGTYTDPAGLVSYSGTNYKRPDCTWLIKVQNNRAVSLRFQEFAVEGHEHCIKDYVEIHDGNTTSSPKIGRFCGNILPNSLKTTSNMALIHFVSDNTGAGSSFKIAYATTLGTLQGCGGFLNSTSGTFSSVDENRDGQYENLLDCIWVITGQEDSVIQFTVTSIDIELGDVACEYDVLKVYNSFIMNDNTLVGSYCGTSIPPIIQSSMNVLTIQFTSDEYTTGSGFTADYQQIPAPCRQTITATNVLQMIALPSVDIAHNLQYVMCQWMINADSEIKQINITVLDLSLMENRTCSEEYIEFRDYPLMSDGQAPVYYCGDTIPPTWISTSYQAVINLRFLQDRQHSLGIIYQIANCDRTYTADGGVIYSAGWPYDYSNSENCSIIITSSNGTRISLFFNWIDIENDEECRLDYLEIYDGPFSTNNSLGRFCGSMIPDPLYSSSNIVSMRFISDVDASSAGYSITYTAYQSDIVGCGGTINAVQGSFTSPQYPNSYNTTGSCEWLIVSPRRHTVTLTFESLMLIGSQDCSANSVAMYDGNTPSSPLIAKYCGDQLTAQRTTTTNIALVKLVSDGVHAEPRFRLTFNSHLTEL